MIMYKALYVALVFCLMLTGCFQLKSAAPENEPPVALEPLDASGSGEADAEPPNISDNGANVDEPEGPLTVTVTIPEGYTLARIGMTLEDRGLFTAQEFIRAAQDGDFTSFPLIVEQETESNRCFTLEGYLFPDTYEFYASSAPEAVISKILVHTEQMITQELREEILNSGYTVDEIITIASIIQKEALTKDSMLNISSVLHNRLSVGMQLQCDVTIAYVEGAVKPFITGDTNRYNDDYNTYKCPALPAGPICNPGIDAIKAALRPADTQYLYFVTDQDLNFYYSETWEEHVENVGAAMPDSG